jgi:uncharacterized membrane protein
MFTNPTESTFYFLSIVFAFGFFYVVDGFRKKSLKSTLLGLLLCIPLAAFSFYLYRVDYFVYFKWNAIFH